MMRQDDKRLNGTTLLPYGLERRRWSWDVTVADTFAESHLPQHRQQEKQPTRR